MRTPILTTSLLLGSCLACGAALAQQADSSAATQPTASTTIVVGVGAESADLVHRVRFGPDGMVVEKTIPVGESPVEMEGPHGLQISPDGKYLHMTTGHGFPDGKYWRYELGPDTLVGPGINLGMFPASIDVTPDGLYAFVVNFNLHGAMVPSSVRASTKHQSAMDGTARWATVSSVLSKSSDEASAETRPAR